MAQGVVNEPRDALTQTIGDIGVTSSFPADTQQVLLEFHVR